MIRLAPSSGPFQADGVEELPAVDDLRCVEKRVAAGAAGVDARGQRCRPRELTDRTRGERMDDLVRDDPSGGAE